MKKVVFLFLLALPFVLFAQSDRVVDQSGNLVYQYNRTIEMKADSGLVVTFVFVNGKKQIAISLRQEIMEGDLVWISSDLGNVKQEKIVNACTANVPPNTSLCWKYLYKPQKSSTSPNLERSALMIMKDDYQVNKIIFLPSQASEPTPQE